MGSIVYIFENSKKLFSDDDTVLGLSVYYSGSLKKILFDDVKKRDTALQSRMSWLQNLKTLHTGHLRVLFRTVIR